MNISSCLLDCLADFRTAVVRERDRLDKENSLLYKEKIRHDNELHHCETYNVRKDILDVARNSANKAHREYRHSMEKCLEHQQVVESINIIWAFAQRRKYD